VAISYNNPLTFMVRIQNRERIHGFERRRLCRVANIAERTCFVGNMATLQLRFDDGEWPSGKAPGSGPSIRGESCRWQLARQPSLENLISKTKLRARQRWVESQKLKIRICSLWLILVGDWPSGKALGSGPRIGGSNPSSPARENAFESLIPSQ
jgi:hypothetical protein